MASPSNSRRFSSSKRRGSFLVLSEDPTYSLTPKGQSVLASLIRNRSTTSLLNSNVPDEEEGIGGSEWPTFRPTFQQQRDSSHEDELLLRGNERLAADERRMSAILNTPQMRSMRLIGNSNPRYKWERYWKTEDELKKIKRKSMCVFPPLRRLLAYSL
jgi:hypothetical protein